MIDPHPILIHFPIALLTLGAAADLTGVLLDRPEWTRAGWYALLAGAPLAIAAAVTGLLAALGTGELDAAVEDLLNLHGTLVTGSVVLVTLLFVVRFPWRPGLPPRRGLYAVALVAAAGLLVAGAYLGGELVYVHGVGVGRAGS
jgi:uncharacterized membrane protein